MIFGKQELFKEYNVEADVIMAFAVHYIFIYYMCSYDSVFDAAIHGLGRRSASSSWRYVE